MRVQMLHFALFTWICLFLCTFSGVSIAQNYPDYQMWNFPDGAIARFGKGGISQGDRVIAFSPDGGLLALATTIGVWLYDVETIRVALLPGESRWSHALAFSPDGATRASGSADKNVKLWDVSTGKEITTFKGHTDRVGSVAFSPDGTILAAGSSDDTVKLWEVSRRTNIATLRGNNHWVRDLEFSPDGTKLASASLEGTILLWDLKVVD